MTVTLAQVSADTGECYDAVDGGTTAVTALITRATNFATLVGSTADAIVRPLADALVINQIIGNIDGVNKTIGNLSVGNKDLKSMRDYFMQESRKACILKGYSLDGLRIELQDSEQ